MPQLLPNNQLQGEIAACRAQGYQSIALITKTRRDAERWQQALSLPMMGRNAALGDVFLVPQLRDRFGFPLRSLKELRLRFEEDAVTMEVDVDEAKLAGGAGDNLLAGSYRFVPWGKPCTPPVESKIVEPFGDLILPCNGFAHTENGVVRYWLETADGIRLRQAGYALQICPESRKSALRIAVQAADAEFARRLAFSARDLAKALDD